MCNATHDITMNLHQVKAITFHHDSYNGTKWVKLILAMKDGSQFDISCFEDHRGDIELPETDLVQALQGTMGLIRKAQERLCQYLVQDFSGDDREAMIDLLGMGDREEG